ncbi:MAG: hypothetical protein C4K49_08770 [Candidatus Thorarchaeota archaeon]|nr:MAG: hypothetical protein C4K49_08770 [Candidatus Thorarchaeota archaeon]
MSKVLHLSVENVAKLYSHAQDCLPLESAGLLFGHLGGSVVTVTRVELLKNALRSRIRFEIDPVTEYELLLDAETRGEELVGIFHSHPAPPQPSEADLQNMSLNPVVWLIASRTTGTWLSRAFVLRRRKAVEVPVILS